jgi:hypothetical protein
MKQNPWDEDNRLSDFGSHAVAFLSDTVPGGANGENQHDSDRNSFMRGIVILDSRGSVISRSLAAFEVRDTDEAR